jgi:hypothetical protein
MRVGSGQLKLRMALIAGVSALAVLAGITAPAGASTARTGSATADAQPAAASGWVQVYLHAYSGNGCASYQDDVRLEPITSEPCVGSAYWYYRDLSRSSGSIAIGDHLEFVDETKTYALGYSGGSIKLETPNADTTYVIVAQITQVGGTFNWQELLIPVSGLGILPGYGIYPEGAGQGLGTPVDPSVPPDAWLECPPANRQCTGGILV